MLPDACGLLEQRPIQAMLWGRYQLCFVGEWQPTMCRPRSLEAAGLFIRRAQAGRNDEDLDGVERKISIEISSLPT